MDTDIDVNILIQSFTDRVSQLTSDNILKDAIIKQLSAKIEELTKSSSLIEEEK